MKFVEKLLVSFILRMVYSIFSCKKTDEKLVIFADERQSGIPSNIKPVYENLKDRGLKTVVLCKPVKNIFTRLIYYIRFTRYYAVAKYIVVGDYFPPLFFNKPKKGQKVIQLWHAAGAFKKFGYSTIKKTWGTNKKVLDKFPIHNNYTHVVVSSKEIIPHYMEAFNIKTDIIHAYGFPRSDVFFDGQYKEQSREKLLEVFPCSEGKKIILYAPTFRGRSADRAFDGNMLDYCVLSKNLSKDYVIIIKYHPLVKDGMLVPAEFTGFAKDITEKMDISEALCSADILITDYSSVVFEYALLERPMVFYAYDLEKYINERDFYYPYAEFVPGPVVKNNAKLIKAIKDMDKTFDVYKVRAFKEKYMGACDGNSAKRIAEKIIGAY